MHPEKRSQDVCIVGTQHYCNGIETDVVAHVYPTDCHNCQRSDADPVIISRAKAMLIISTYHRLDCQCGYILDFTLIPQSEEENITAPLINGINSRWNVSREAHVSFKNRICTWVRSHMMLSLFFSLFISSTIVIFSSLCATHTFICQNTSYQDISFLLITGEEP